MTELSVDICVIGAGSGGLSVAAGAVQMGASVALVEGGKMGGDCLNYGCVPSKALLAASKRAHAMKGCEAFGIKPSRPKIDFKQVHKHIKDVIKTIEPNDSEERFHNLGVHVVRDYGEFTSPSTLKADGYQIHAKRFVIATGSSAAIPAVPGLKNVKFYTNETIFNLKECPKHLVIIGGGPIGCEMAQAFARLGAKVTILEMFSIFPRDDHECVQVVRKQLMDDGIEIFEGVKVLEALKTGKGPTIVIESHGKKRRLNASHLLVAAGRKANVESLALERAGVEYTPRGIKVDERLRTTNKKIFAIGDVAGGMQFTHVANYHAGIVIRNALFRLPAKASTKAVPWVTYTEPELAHVGMLHDEAQGKYPGAKTLKFPFSDIDRALAERDTDGMIKVTTTKSGVVLGTTIVGAHAGELLAPWVSVIGKGGKIGEIATPIAAYPTFSEINKRVAGSYFTPMLFSEKTKRIVRFLLKWG